jgi:hypothetical protein
MDGRLSTGARLQIPGAAPRIRHGRLDSPQFSHNSEDVSMPATYEAPVVVEDARLTQVTGSTTPSNN